MNHKYIPMKPAFRKDPFCWRSAALFICMAIILVLSVQVISLAEELRDLQANYDGIIQNCDLRFCDISND